MNMRLAVTYDYDTKEVFQHFGQTQNFLLVEVEDNKIKSTMIVDNGGFSHSGLVEYLSHLEVNTLICGGLGSHAIDFLERAGIEVIPGATGDALEAVNKYLKGELSGDMSVIHECSHDYHKDN